MLKAGSCGKKQFAAVGNFGQTTHSIRKLRKKCSLVEKMLIGKSALGIKSNRFYFFKFSLNFFSSNFEPSDSQGHIFR